MTFKERLIDIYNILEQQPDNIKQIEAYTFKYSEAFKYICQNIENIIGSNTHNNMILCSIIPHDDIPMTCCILDQMTKEFSTCVIGHCIFLPKKSFEDPFFWFWYLTHEMTHVFLSIKNSKISSSYDLPSVLEEGLATYMAKYLYNKYFSSVHVSYPIISNNDFAYDYAENIYKQIMVLNNNNISFIKKIRQINPSLKQLNDNDFSNIIITKELIGESMTDFQRKFNKFLGFY